MSSETHTASSDGNAIQGDHEAAVTDNHYPSSNATTTTRINKYAIATYQLRTLNDNYWSFAVVCLICFICSIVLLVIGVISFVVSSNKQAYVPPLTFKVVSLEVGSMTISNNSSSGFHKYMSGDVNLALSLTNKNQEQLLIEPLVVSLMYDDESLSSETIDPLYLSSLNHKSVQLDMGITASQLNVVTVDSISTDLAMNHSLVFKIFIQGRYSILKSGDIADHIHGVKITCDGVKVNFKLVESNLTTLGSLINVGSGRRVTTVARRWAGKNSPEISAGFDQEAVATVMARLAIDRAKKHYAREMS